MKTGRNYCYWGKEEEQAGSRKWHSASQIAAKTSKSCCSRPLAKAMTPGTMMRTRANILMKVKVIWVREAMVTLQQLTATTNAATEKGVQHVSHDRMTNKTRLWFRVTHSLRGCWPAGSVPWALGMVWRKAPPRIGRRPGTHKRPQLACKTESKDCWKERGIWPSQEERSR